MKKPAENMEAIKNMHRFWNMIFFLSFELLNFLKYVLVKNECMQKQYKKTIYDYLVAKSGISIIFPWKVGKMCGVWPA